MPLTAVDIYPHLPHTNCGDCGVPTCMAFAMKLAQQQASLDECPHVSEEAQQALESASAPPMATVTVGEGENELKVGGETVLFRHEERFHHPCGIAPTVDTSLSDEEIVERIEKINTAEYDRVGMMLGVDLIALRDSGNGRLTEAVELAQANSDLPLVLMTDSVDAMGAALEICGDSKPLLCGANAENVDDMMALAADNDCPLVLRGNGLELAEELGEKAAAADGDQFFIDSGATNIGDMVRHQTIMRRLALNQKFDPFRFPTFVECSYQEPEQQVTQANAAIAKYPAVIVTDLVEPQHLLPLITARLNIYTDPQKPIQVEPKLYEVGDVTEDSPVLVTTNFSLTYYLVEGDVMTSKVPAYILAVQTDGTSVLTAWAAGDLTGDSIGQAVEDAKIEEKVSHRKLVLPGGVAVLQGKTEEACGWEVVVGPEQSSDLAQFFRQRGWS
ncbi:MAG: acetyl-CoA decarbonylase/synthase complex subunit gamma [Armatimonadota bacterium]